MTRSAACVLLLALLAGLIAAQDGGDAQPDKTTIHLKSGEDLEGNLKKVDEDGVTLDIGDGMVLLIRWPYTRGDKHIDLRKRATNFQNLASVLKLADFCHEFAMDTEEAFALAAALKLAPTRKDLRERLNALPQPQGLEVPPEPGTDTQPEPEPEPKPEPGEDPKEPKPLPPPTRGTFKVYIEMVNEDAAAVTWLTEQFEQMRYKVGSKSDHEVVLKVDMTLTCTRNPKFMGAELYAIFDGSLTYTLTKKGESKSFATDTVKNKDIRRDTKAEALAACRKDLLQDSFQAIHRELEKQR